MVESDADGTRPMHGNAPAPGPSEPFTITLLVSADVDLELVARLTEEAADRFMDAVEQATGAPVVDKLIWDPQHQGEFECGCSGPVGWHCPGEESQHWAKGDTLDSECGHCGSDPEIWPG